MGFGIASVFIHANSSSYVSALASVLSCDGCRLVELKRLMREKIAKAFGNLFVL